MSEATSSINDFSYQPEKVKAGTVFHYIKSNIDESYPAHIFLYIPDNDHLEVLKLEAHGMDAAFVHAHMDWKTFSADRLESWWVLPPDGERKSQASLSSSAKDKTFTIAWQGRSEIVPVRHYPVHIYNFDFISLNHIFPHWSHPKAEMMIGILQPNFDPELQTMMKYEGAAVIRYLEDDLRNRQSCRKYRIAGAGLKNAQGYIWANRQTGYIEDMEIPIANNPDWQDFKFRLVSQTHMNSRQWADFIVEEVRKLKQT